MKEFLGFLRAVRGLRDIKRQGVLYYGVKEKDVDSATDHTFRLTLMVWLLGQGKKLNLAKAMKLALVHDLCKVYTGDITPYEGLFPKGKKDYKLAWRWRRLSLKEKQKRHKEKARKEQAAMRKLSSKLPADMRKDILASWDEFRSLATPEARFVLQVDRIENLLEAFEQFEGNRKFPTQPWWEHADEVVESRELQELLEAISQAEINVLKEGKRKKRKKT